MTENVIDKKIREWRELANEIEHPSGDDVTGCSALTLRGCAKQLGAITCQEQFIPSVKEGEWPDFANWCVIDFSMMLVMCHDEPLWDVTVAPGGWNARGKGPYGYHSTVYIPPGIDPRIKVSRKQMEEYEGALESHHERNNRHE